MRLTLSRIRPRRWAATIAATALSGYALDGVATVFGVALAASQILNGLDQTSLLGFLLVTYVFWFLGLRASLAANWSLLEATGTSTNAVSKFAYDLTGHVRRAGARRFASAGGYLTTEILKEIPYYAGAFGVAIVSDTVDSKHVLIFLAGTNLGAAAYEFGLARLTRSFLGHRRPIAENRATVTT